MPRRHYDLDEVLALAEAGKTAAEIVEELGLPVGERAIQKAINKFVGPLPKRPAARSDKMRPRVVAWMVAHGLNEKVCCVCFKPSVFDMYLRELKRDDELGSLIFVCRHCKRVGDF
ncbi:hypothetical protein QM806_04565 [Rhodococcus sp. IEGM 1351]|uniref:hypothetical protein n=1 Tax=Rhodococcus sp. IEGM 1351 TaxID=3047089 RepID=UPI0024B6BFEF|nr:hypothetical protein [Rhodococcus sp. IEGM 1351]MDI9934728.1 hypothetical protein [Rhodococcus sp. IEGM 1351]